MKAFLTFLSLIVHLLVVSYPETRRPLHNHRCRSCLGPDSKALAQNIRDIISKFLDNVHLRSGEKEIAALDVILSEVLLFFSVLEILNSIEPPSVCHSHSLDPRARVCISMCASVCVCLYVSVCVAFSCSEG